MARVNIVDALNQVLATLNRSLSMYLTYGSPWVGSGEQQAAAVVRSIAEDQQRICQRLVDAILDRDGAPDFGEFALEFTDTNLLSLEYLLQELMFYARQDIARLEEAVDWLKQTADRQARDLAEEALGAERAHLESLEALIQQPA